MTILSKKMKIGIDIRTAGGEKAGKGRFTFNIVRSLLKQDKKSRYFLYADSGIAGFEEFENAQLVVIDAKGLSWHRAVIKDLKYQEIDTFFAPTSFIIPALLPKKSQTRVILTVHDLIAFLYPTSHEFKAVVLEKFFMKKALKKANKITTVSENTKKDLVQKFSINEEKIQTIPCAASENFFPIKRTDENIEKLNRFIKKTNLPRKYFLAVGTVEERKNIDTLIQALAMINQKHPKHHLLIVGKPGWGHYQESLEDLINKNYLQKYVHFLGYVTNKTLNKLYNLAEAFVFPSYYEGFGMPPLEAMQAGCPVISSHSSSMPEVLKDAALFADPSNPSEFASAMENIINDQNLRTDLVNKGRIQSKNFSWDSSAQNFLNLLQWTNNSTAKE
jgi:glycosyltransferase involved in cell wall biosynthesis